MKPIQPPILWASGALYTDIKQLGCEADHTLPSSPEVKNEYSHMSTPPLPSWRAKGQLYFAGTIFLSGLSLVHIHRIQSVILPLHQPTIKRFIHKPDKMLINMNECYIHLWRSLTLAAAII